MCYFEEGSLISKYLESDQVFFCIDYYFYSFMVTDHSLYDFSFFKFVKIYLVVYFGEWSSTLEKIE